MGEIEPAGESLGADKNVDFAGFDFGIEVGEVLTLLIIAIKAGDFGTGEEAGEFGFEQFGTKTFVNNARGIASGAGFGDFFLMATEVTGESVTIGMESHW